MHGNLNIKTVVLTFVYFVLYCVHLFCLCVMCFFFLTSFMSDRCVTEFVDLQNVCVCARARVCVCVHVYTNI